MKRLLSFLACLLICQAGGSQTTQPEVKATPQRAEVNTSTTSGRDQLASRTESSVVSYAEAFTFAGEPKLTGYPNPVTRLTNTTFLVAYDEKRENPAWAAYRISGMRKYGPLPRPARFATDTRTKARVTHSNYTRTGFDRGHMVPNLAIASRFGVEAQAETFLMSNIVPQKPALNQGPWRLLEETLSETTAARCTDIWVIVGPIYEGPVKKLPSGSVVPSAFFMLIADETAQGPRFQAFIMPQATKRGANFREFRTSVQEVQAKTGLNFYWELPDPIEMRLETENADYWLE